VTDTDTTVTTIATTTTMQQQHVLVIGPGDVVLCPVCEKSALDEGWLIECGTCRKMICVACWTDHNHAEECALSMNSNRIIDGEDNRVPEIPTADSGSRLMDVDSK
jgi:hypothetical protein